MINFNLLKREAIKEGYSEDVVEAKISQDLILLLISKSPYKRNITIKGGVVMRSISCDVRRATIDIDFDFIRYPITDAAIKKFIHNLNNLEDIRVDIIGKIDELKHQDYKGKRINVRLKDTFDNYLHCKIDIGIQKSRELNQEEYCFEITSYKDTVTLLVNTKEQMFGEKLKSLIRFGKYSTRFKDIFDMYYLIPMLNSNSLIQTINVLIFSNSTLHVNNFDDLYEKAKTIFNNSNYLSNLKTSNRNWVEIDISIVIKTILDFLYSLTLHKD